MELRGFKGGGEPDEDKPGWPTGIGAPDNRPDSAPDGEGEIAPADGQGSQWWPETGHGAGATGPNGNGPAGPRWGISTDNGAAAGSGASQPTSSALERSGYSYGRQGPNGWSDASAPPWAAGGQPPATYDRAQPGQTQRGPTRPGPNQPTLRGPGLTRSQQARTGPARPQSALRRAWQRFITVLAAVGAFLAKFGALLLKVKYVGLVLSMVVSIVAYSLFFGWSFAVGIVLLILVHEMGHVVELRRQGVPASAPLFIPFLGAFVNMRGSPRSAYQEALSGLAGPLIGTAASVVVAFWANATGSKFLMALAFFGFFVNLFNLLPVLPLDGGRAAAALHPALWLLGLVALLVFEFLYPSPVIPIVLILGGIELWRRWRYRNSPASRAYNALLPQQRLAIGAFYLALVAVTIVGAHATYIARSI
jgi:Zn-dependent protease